MTAYTYHLGTSVIITLTVLMIAIFSAWLFLLIYTIISFNRLSKLEYINKQQHAIVGDQCPKVSVILPARNEEKYIEKCIDSLLKQSYPNFEIVAINDSSSASSLKHTEVRYRVKTTLIAKAAV
jgi:chlorobactene glucosyltransferase